MSKEQEKSRVQVQQAYNAAKQAGKVPAGMKRVFEDIEPVTDWRDVLSKFVSENVGKNDYTFRRVNRRFIGRGLVLPTLYSKSLGKIAFAVDTSGSVSHRMISEMISEISAAIETYEEEGAGEISIPVIYCDADIGGIEFLEPGDTPNPVGGGGTRFTPVFEEIATNEDLEDAVALVYLTDGYCNDFPDEAPHYPVIWGLTERNEHFKPPFGEKFLIRETEEGNY
jgi:predicted metal-dependent peptidase